MMNRFTTILIAFAVVFVAGWLFGHDYPPPDVADMRAATWIVGVMVAIVMAGMVTGGTQR